MTTSEATKPNCMDCPHRSVVADPDPYDWFCQDDEAVLCTKAENTERQVKWSTGIPWRYRAITVSCRPHKKREECAQPDWCPLLEEKADEG